MSLLLFIGGCADGRRIEVFDGCCRYKAHRLRPLGLHYPDEGGFGYGKEETMLVDHYERVRFAFADLMLLEGMSTSEAIDRLLANYRPGPAIELKGNDPSYVMQTDGIDLLAKGARPHLLIMKLPEE